MQWDFCVPVQAARPETLAAQVAEEIALKPDCTVIRSALEGTTAMLWFRRKQ